MLIINTETVHTGQNNDRHYLLLYIINLLEKSCFYTISAEKPKNVSLRIRNFTIYMA